jgi:tRNA-2-methylthio-N6-dimethylallyladenosine synthase
MSVARGKYHIWTVGCQMNQADSQRVASILDGLGWESAPTMDAANLVVLNTCSVREQPEKRAHGQLSLLRHAKRSREDLLVAMMGCMIGNQRTIDDLKQRYPVVDLFFKVESADILPHFLEERWTPIAGEGCIDFADLGAPRTIGATEALPVLPMPTLHTLIAPMQITPRPAARDLHYPGAAEHLAQTRGPTAWLPVVLGCNKVCSYCIVPSRRGVERSRPLEELLDEAGELTAQGARELTLLGQTVEAYGLDLPDQHADLGDLMEQLSAIDGLERIRFMTSYPRHMTDKIIKQMAALPKVCEHVNIPVQHGDDEVLRRMRRGYSITEYRQLIERLRAWWPGVTLSTDVIVGFCGETEEEFQRLLDLLEEIRFDVVHVAAYSPRPGTLSYKWEDDVPLAVKKARLHAVETVQERISREINATYLGRVEEVLVENRQTSNNGQQQWRGRNRANKLVFFPATRPGAEESATAGGGVATLARTEIRPGALAQVVIVHTSAWSLLGTRALG